MKRQAIVLALSLGVLAACSVPQTQMVPPAADVVERQEVVTGSNGEVEFILSDDAFRVERPTLVHVLLLAMYLPLFVM